MNKVTIMYKATIKNKIPEVYAAARVIVQRYGHTKKFAKCILDRRGEVPCGFCQWFFQSRVGPKPRQCNTPSCAEWKTLS